MDWSSSPESSASGRTNQKKLTRRQKSLNSKNCQKQEYTKIWTESEKKDLLRLLYEHGDTNPEMIAAGLPHKHVTQVKTYLRTIGRRVINSEQSKKNEFLQLREWINFLQEKLGKQSLDDSLPFQLYCLSKETPEFKNSMVNFKKAYEYLYSLMVGKKISIDEGTYYFVHSYIEHLLKQFDKHLISDEQELLKSACAKRLTTNNIGGPLDIFCLLHNKTLKKEQYLHSKRILKSICRTLKRYNFKRNAEMDHRTQLLQEEEITIRNNLELDPSSSCIIVPHCRELEFRNLSSFIWSALFNLSSKDREEIVEAGP